MSTDTTKAPDLSDLARQARWHVVKTVTAVKAGHIGGPLSMMDLLVGLYFRELRIKPDEPNWPDRDRFVLSKGHAAIGLYSVLALRGFFDVDELATFDRGDSRLQGHPDVARLPGLDASTGSLGQGLSAGLGMALGARLGAQEGLCGCSRRPGSRARPRQVEATPARPRWPSPTATSGMGR